MAKMIMRVHARDTLNDVVAGIITACSIQSPNQNTVITMNLNRQSFIEAVSAALRAERDGAQKMDPCIGFYRNGNEIVCRYESALSPTERIHFVRWDAGAFGIHDRVSEMTDDAIKEDATGVLEIFEDEILEDILDVL